MSALRKFKRNMERSQESASGDIFTIDGKQYSAPELRVLEKAGALGIGYKNNPASSTATGPTLQGPFNGTDSQFGIFSSPGVRPERFSALHRPLTLARLLIEQGALQQSVYMNEVLEIMTGVTAGAGSNATDWCANPPIAGSAKVSQQVFGFGQEYIKTNLNAVPKIGRLRGRADIPGKILNAGPEANPLIPDVMYQLNDTRSQLQYELWLLGVQLEQSLEKVCINGNSALASTSTQLGFIKEFNGLDSQIKTGYTDSVTSIATPALDSIVENFSNLVSGTQASTGRNIQQVISDMVYAIKQRAARVGMGEFDSCLLMRQEFFRALTDIYACSYAVARCTNTQAGTPQWVDQTYINNLRLEMLNGQYLLVEGIHVPVVFSDGITLNRVGATQFNNSIYYVPLSWQGRPLLRLEYFPMDNQYAAEFGSFVGADRYRVLNNGLYLVGYRSTGLCDEYHFASSKRLILETPFLAARIDNIQFNYVAQTHSAYSGETGLYANGGVTYRSPIFSTQ